MSQTLQNQITYAKSMSGVVSLSDGAGTVIENGTITSNDISGNNITTNSFTANDLILPRKNTALIPVAGSNIDLDLLIQNFEFNSATRFLRLYADDTTYIFDVDLSGNGFSILANTFNMISNIAVINANAWLFQNTPITFSGSSMSFGNMLPTSTLNPTLSTQLITKNYGDTTYATLASLAGYAQLAAANSFTEQNTFRKGILPCRGTGANPESDIQLAGNNQLQFRAATSANNISIGALSLQGSTSTPANNTGVRNIAISHNSLQNLQTGSDNTFVGYQSGQNTASSILQNVAIGNYAMQNAGGSSIGCIVVGYNSGRNVNGAGNIIIGANAGNSITSTGGSIIIGNGTIPSAQDNSVIVIGNQAGGGATGNSLNSSILLGERAGYNLSSGSTRNYFFGTEAGYNTTSGNYCFFLGFNTGYANTTGYQQVAVGSESMRFNSTGYNNTAIGFQCLYWNQTGFSNTAVGHQAGVHTAINLSHTLCLGQSSAAQISNECVFGGETAVSQVYLTLPNKHRIAMNQSPTGVTINLAFRSNENVLITDTTTTGIQLPTPAGTQNIGAKYNIQRSSATSNNITITAPAGQTISFFNSSGTFTTAASYVMLANLNNLSLLCINSSGNSWTVINNEYYNINNYLTTASAASTYQTISNMSNYQLKLLQNTSLDIKAGDVTITNSAANAQNLVIGTQTILDSGTNNIILGKGSFNLSNSTDNVLIGSDILDFCTNTSAKNVIIGTNNGEQLTDSEENTFIGNRICQTNGYNIKCTALGASCNFANASVESTAIGYGAISSKSNEIVIGRSTEEVFFPGKIYFKKYLKSEVNPTTITASTTLTGTLYEYYKVNAAATCVITLPVSANVVIGTVLKFRKTGNMSISTQLLPNTGQSIFPRGSATTQTTATTVMSSTNAFAGCIYIDTNIWAVTD